MNQQLAPIDATADPAGNPYSQQTNVRRLTWKKATAALTISGLLVAAYAVWPLYALCELQHAITHGDTRVLEQKIVWPSFKSSFKDTLRAQAFPRLLTGLETQRESGWTTRAIALELADYIVGELVERNVTPENLRNIVRTGSIFYELGLHNPDLPSGVLKRLSFASARTFSVELGRPTDPATTLVATLALTNFDWKLVGIQVVGPAQESPPAPIVGTMGTATRAPSSSAPSSGVGSFVM